MARKAERLGGYDFVSLDGLRRIKMIKDILAELMKHAELTERGKSFRPGVLQDSEIEYFTEVSERPNNQRLWNKLRELLQEVENTVHPRFYLIGIELGTKLGHITMSDYKDFLRRTGTRYDSPDHLYKEIEQAIQRAENEPVRLDFYGQTNCWIFKGVKYLCEGTHSPDQQRLLVMEEFDKERRYWEGLRRKFDSPEDQESARTRPRIPESVRIQVWRRDGGKCARCGSREKLEYDHIVPISRGGSNTARNIELLCEQCNRSKGAKIE